MKRKISKEEFVLISNKIHSNKYNYDLVKTFNKVKDKVDIICPIHGIFNQDVYSHKKGCGCPKCGRKIASIKKTQTKDTFISKCLEVHGDKYDYSKSIIVDNNTKTIITCKIHGDFLQTPDKHKQGRGCPECALENKGWSKSSWKKLIKSGEIAKLYVLNCYNNKENFIKIGRTKNEVKRRYGTKREMPYKYKIIKIVLNENSDKIFSLEIKLKQFLKDYKYKPKIHFMGDTECYKIETLENLTSFLVTQE